MQTLSQVHVALTKIAKCGFNTGIYLVTFNAGENSRLICFAALNHHRRYFRMTDAGTNRTLIHPINRSESGKPIEKVNSTLAESPIVLEYLIRGGHDSVLRGLGLYRALYERRKLKREDFSLSNLWTSVLTSKTHGFNIQFCDVETLEVDKRFSYIGDHTEQSAHEVAKELRRDDRFAVVVNEFGFTVAVYHQGERVA